MEDLKLKKFGSMDYIVLPELNDKTLKKLSNMAKIRCWKNICVSDNLLDNEKMIKFASENSLKIMDGNWLFKNIVDKVLEYVVDFRNDIMANQEISFLCNKLDETILEKLKEIATKVKICNVLTSNAKQYNKLEEEIYQTKGIILNVSNNYKRALTKSNVIINFDFSLQDLKKCILPKNGYLINLDPKMKLDKKELNTRNIVFYEIDMPFKYIEYQEKLQGFNSSILYESFIYKNTNYKNIKKELLKDDLQIIYLQDSKGKAIKKSNLNFEKTLDKITI